MFTGIIEELGRVISLERRAAGARLKIGCRDVTCTTKDGDSIAVNGVCLTSLNITPNSFEAELSPETLERSTLGTLSIGSPVNLERAAMPSTRLGGHIVQGHVDGRGTFVSAESSGDFWTVRIGYPAELARYFVYKGSVAVDGISLTIANLEKSHFDIAAISKTWERTNLAVLVPKAPVNLEVDIIAKYVERMLAFANF